jgi:hypothetical protein
MHVSGLVAFALVPVVIFGLLDAMYLPKSELTGASTRAWHRQFAMDLTVGATLTNFMRLILAS